jgi:hypothetical protein
MSEEWGPNIRIVNHTAHALSVVGAGTHELIELTVTETDCERPTVEALASTALCLVQLRMSVLALAASVQIPASRNELRYQADLIGSVQAWLAHLSDEHEP